jgi:hypothetical protein
MKSTAGMAFAAILVAILLVPTAHADEGKTATLDVAAAEPGKAQGEALQPRVKDELVKMHAHFKRFAKKRIASLNRNHLHSRSRMKVEQMPNGHWRARYHEYATNTERCRVRKKSSKQVPYTGTMILEERVYESVAETRTECRTGDFSVVERKPNYVIFRFQNGSWK